MFYFPPLKNTAQIEKVGKRLQTRWPVPASLVIPRYIYQCHLTGISSEIAVEASISEQKEKLYCIYGVTTSAFAF